MNEQEEPPSRPHRPGRPMRAVFASRVYDGSMVISERVWRWVWPWERDVGFWPRIGRLAWVIALIVGGLKMAGRYPNLWYLYVGGWVWWSIRQDPRERVQRTARDRDQVAELLLDDDHDLGDDEDQADEDEPVDVPATATPEQVRAWIVPKIREVMGDANGVHLDTLLEELVARGHLVASYRLTMLRTELVDAGIPVREQLKIGRANRMGVHRADLDALLDGGAAQAPRPSGEPSLARAAAASPPRAEVYDRAVDGF